MSIRERETPKLASPEELVPQVKEVVRRSRNILRDEPVGPVIALGPVQPRMVWCKERYWIARDHETAYRIVMLGIEPEGCFSTGSKEVLSGPLDHGLFIWGVEWQKSKFFALHDIPCDPKLVTPSRVWHLNITDSELVQKIENGLKWGHAIGKNVYQAAFKAGGGIDREKFASKILEG